MVHNCSIGKPGDIESYLSEGTGKVPSKIFRQAKINKCDRVYLSAVWQSLLKICNTERV